MTDTCPNCVHRGCRPAIERHRGEHVVHGYRCPACGHQWATSRLLTAYSDIHAARARRTRQPRNAA